MSDDTADADRERRGESPRQLRLFGRRRRPTVHQRRIGLTRVRALRARLRRPT